MFSRTSPKDETDWFNFIAAHLNPIFEKFKVRKQYRFIGVMGNNEDASDRLYTRIFLSREKCEEFMAKHTFKYKFVMFAAPKSNNWSAYDDNDDMSNVYYFPIELEKQPL